ncbi:protocadherin alpha-C2-like [Protopterus annectens]|uniref:protocadherin alpha-C2-like n=1 Tax=Protopterus annectens TaxID=7888 RepID=UPI001CFB051C|nr:protocadherin alpha-C2-like [Protopterus annectens]
MGNCLLWWYKMLPTNDIRMRFWWAMFVVLFTLRSYCVGDIIFTVSEELPNGSLVGNINNDLGFGGGQLTNRELSVVFGDSKQYLFINPESGNMFVNERIDREMICSTRTTCRVNFRVIMKRPFQLFSVKMEIIDVNDNAPVFPVKDLHLTIMESIPVGTVFPIRSASDPDVGSNGVSIYRLSPNGHFSLDIYNSTDGGFMVHLSLDKSLDREQKSFHRLFLTAIDGGEPARSGTLEIAIKVTDANDNSPVFDKPIYKVGLVEDAPTGMLVIQVKATDMDEGANGEILYSFSSHTSDKLQEMFDINSSNGEIRLKTLKGIEEAASYELHVQATDKGSPTMTGYSKVVLDIIDVNNHPPEIAVTSVSNNIMEDAVSGTVVALISIMDRDSGLNALVNCEVTESIPFKLRSVIEYYTLVTDGPLDREIASSYNITVTATDSGSPPLSTKASIIVQIADVNDNPPRFSQELYKVYINENNSVGDFLCQVVALDPDLDLNGKVTYSVLDKDLNNLPVINYVSVSNENGNLYARTILDYEKQRDFEILIKARDQGNPPLSSTATVQVSIVDQNDNPPMFLYPPTTEGYVAVEMVPRSAEMGFLVTKVITVDADSGQNAWLSYQLLHASDTSLVAIDRQTGEIKTSRQVKATDPNKHKLVIEVRDNGIPRQSATVTIGLWLYDTFPQVLPDFGDAVNNDSDISSLNIYLIITVVAISFLFIGVLIVLLSVFCYKHENTETCPCFTICGEFEPDSYKIKVPVPENSPLPTDLLDFVTPETPSHSYQCKASVGIISQNNIVPAENYKTGDCGLGVTSEGRYIQIANIRHTTKGDNVVCINVCTNLTYKNL